MNFYAFVEASLPSIGTNITKFHFSLERRGFFVWFSSFQVVHFGWDKKEKRRKEIPSKKEKDSDIYPGHSLYGLFWPLVIAS